MVYNNAMKINMKRVPAHLNVLEKIFAEYAMTATARIYRDSRQGIVGIRYNGTLPGLYNWVLYFPRDSKHDIIFIYDRPETNIKEIQRINIYMD